MVPSWADQLQPQLLMEQFYTLPILCRHIEHMHEEVCLGKSIFFIKWHLWELRLFFWYVWIILCYIHLFHWPLLCGGYLISIAYWLFSFLSWKCCLLFRPAAYIQVHFKLDFIMEANTMDPDQTAPKEQSDLCTYCLQYRLPKNISRRESRLQKLWMVGKGLIVVLVYFSSWHPESVSYISWEGEDS